MDDLFKKLNTLIRATAPDIKPSLPRRDSPPDLDRQVYDLRQRINSALEHEDDLMATVRQLSDTAQRLDSDADAALAQGDEATARHLLAQLNRTQQRLAMAQADLEQHRLSVQDLISRVNLLEATLADHRHASQPAPPPAADPRDEDNNSDKAERLSGMIRDAQARTREGIDKMNDLIQARRQGTGQPDQPDAGASPQASAPQPDDKDMQQRVDRLSRR